MIISRTPFRISFFGGGTDYPAWYRKHGGRVLATTIDRYCYISVRYLPQFFEYKHRIVYSRVEYINKIREIKHPAVRAVLNWLKLKKGVEIHHDGDLPARSGLGSSSAFTVGLIHAMKALEGRMFSKRQLADSAIHVEQNVIKEAVGSQDQILASYGGLNEILFNRDDRFEVRPLALPKARIRKLESHSMLFFTGLSRYAFKIAADTIKNMNKREKELGRISEMVDEAVSILKSRSTSIDQFGKLLDESWQHKRKLSTKISTPLIDQIYQAGMSAGATGGKILGAGGGGFFLFFVKPERQRAVREKLKKLVHVSFNFDPSGSKIVVYEPNDFYTDQSLK